MEEVHAIFAEATLCLGRRVNNLTERLVLNHNATISPKISETVIQSTSSGVLSCFLQSFCNAFPDSDGYYEAKSWF